MTFICVRYVQAYGGTIFLPAAGYRYDYELRIAGSSSRYWSSTQHPKYSESAYALLFFSGYKDWYYDSRYFGYSVRPVSK